jgi:hypothetical protein
MIVVKTWKQLVGIEVTQSYDAIITTIGVETIVAPNMNVVKRGIIIGSPTNLGHELGKFSSKRNLNKNLGPLVANTGVVATPQMVFTNPIMTKTLGTHVFKKKDIRHFIVNHILTPNFHISYN